ncbi:MAG: serine/threonine-protein kinase [Lysobacteraceae bacterium]
MIGDGGMGRVYRGMRDDGEVVQEVAVKLVRSELLNPALLARFSVERRLLAALNHPNICRFLDAGKLDDGTPYVAMEYVPGRPLLEFCTIHRLDLAARVRLLRKVTGAVAHAHRQLIVHRDIKSSNVLVGEDGEPKLLDFGIGTILDRGDDSRERTRTAERFLTPSNAAPEQLRGEPTGVGCDIHALGLLSYELLCGKPAFDVSGLSAGEIERLLVFVPPPLMSHRAESGSVEAAQERAFATPRSLATSLRNDLDAIVATCLRKSPAERYPSAEQLDADLARWLERRPVRARGDDRWYRLRKFVARHQVPVLLASLLTAVLVSAVSVVSWQAVRLADERNVAIDERDRSREVVALLRDAFTSADPARVSGGDMRARDVLAAARPRIEAWRESRPELYASLAATVAEVELGLTLDADAAQLATRAIDTAQQAGVTAAVLRTLFRVKAEASIGLGEYDTAQRALDSMAALDGNPAPDWLVAKARLAYERRQFDDALALLHRANAALSDRGPDDELATRARWEHVQALRRAGRYQAAIAVLDATLDWQLTALPEQHARVALSRLQRIDLLRQSGNLDGAAVEAEAAHRDVLAAYGNRSAMAARSGAALGMALYFADRIEEGVDAYAEARQAWIRVLGPSHPQSMRASYNLASMVEPLPGRSREAGTLFADALRAAEEHDGVATNRTVYMRLGLARWLAGQHDWTEVAKLLTSDKAREGVPAADPDNRREHLELLRSSLAHIDCKANNVAPIAQCDVAADLIQRLAESSR